MVLLLGWIRAGARKSGREGEARVVKPEERVDHMPHTQNYPVEDVLVDLLEVSAGRDRAADCRLRCVGAIGL